MLAMQAPWLRAAEALADAQKAQQQRPELAEALALVQARLARRAAAVLENDEEDLYFEGGRHRQTFLSGLVRWVAGWAAAAGHAGQARVARRSLRWRSVPPLREW